MSFALVSAFFIYFLILLGIGIFSHRECGSEEDFVLGNRSLSFWLTALSAHAADMGAWLFMAMPAAIFLGGLPQIWMAFGLLVGMFLNWQFVAPRLRTMTEKSQSPTLSSFFEKRFRDPSGAIRIVTALISLIFLTCYLSAGLIAMGYLFESLFGINFYIGASLAVSVVIAYTYVGGFVAVAYTDLFQGTFLLLMVLLVPMIALQSIGGVESVFSEAGIRGISLEILESGSFSSIATVVLIALGWGLGYFGQPHIITKFMGIRDPEEIKKAKYLGMTWQLLALGGAVMVGFAGIGYFPEGLPNGELIFVDMVKTLFHPFIGGFILCGVLAANISTMDSQLLVCASVITEDVYKRFFSRSASSDHLLRISRMSVVFVGLFAFGIAATKSASVTSAVFYAWSGLGSAFGPLVIASLYMAKINRQGALAGILTGGLISGAWPLVNDMVVDFAIPSMVPGFSLSLLSIITVSWLAERRTSVKTV